MKYQLEYDKVLLADKAFILEETGELISSVSLWIRFGQVFEKEDSFAEVMVQADGKDCWIPSLLKVGYDQDTKTFSFIPHKELKIGYEVVAYTKEIGDMVSKPKLIEKNEFDRIIQKYGHLFDSDKSLQNCSYSVHKLEEK
ncbi:hypothetical protein [Peribacillus frigoritolerans]|uniref:hypothetical protein n=1 Tax=Peribacillus frigoritolerans TaxID=450367 RepID=UPI0021A88FBC|nr:hypothetical protein [Peribacillus frigoritolerans]MCT1389882.1 hypothetical protein [Peribacillus frigoritolerans]